MHGSGNLSATASTTVAVRAPAGGWLVSPAHDLLLLANLPWVLAWLPGLVPWGALGEVEFWQITFLITPHRWLTLFLVTLDPQRRAGRGAWFAGLAAAIVAVVVLTQTFARTLLCLLLIDYLWNAWHFAAQHAGIVRMYARKCGDPYRASEVWLTRLLVCYTSVRLAGWAIAAAGSLPWGLRTLLPCDALVLTASLAMVGRQVFDRPRQRAGKLCYLASVTGLYASLLVSLWLPTPLATLSLSAAASAFHAIEYFAVVSHYARGRAAGNARRGFPRLARHWGLVLGSYLLMLGIGGFWLDRAWGNLWLSVNLCVAFCHYAFDGLIWRLRVPATARALGITAPVGPAAGEGAGDLAASPASLPRAPVAVSLATADWGQG